MSNTFDFNPFTGQIELVSGGSSGGGNGNLDGGRSDSIYLPSQVIDGGGS